MAESAIGGLALIGVFNHVVENYHYFRLAQDFGSDFQYNQIALHNAGMRISRWGQSIGLTGEVNDQATLDGLIPKELQEGAQKHLGQLLKLMTEAKEQSKSFSACKFIIPI